MGMPQKLKWLEEGAGNPLDESPALYEAALTAFAAHSMPPPLAPFLGAAWAPSCSSGWPTP